MDMRVRLAYGESGLDIEVDPAATTIVEPVHHEAAADQAGVLPAALRDPVALTSRPSTSTACRS